ncbi:MAG TPA: acyl-CoA desaturase [Mycobacteriales bacterium]|nr:acyl-CoA desaturase [Mycobacteriales bacterium]
MVVDVEPRPAELMPRGQYSSDRPFPDPGCVRRSFAQRLQVGITVLLVVGPLVGLGVAVWWLWGAGVNTTDLVLAAALYVITGLGVTVGFHRYLTHRSFTAVPALRWALAVAGSMSFEGDVIGWVAAHRRHHAFTDEPGDPHSPYRYGVGPWAQLRGLLFAHVGWLFRNDPTPARRYAPDLLARRDMRVISRAFPALCVASLALPFGLGWALAGGWHGAVGAMIWAGLVRVGVLQHVTWSVNSLCHVLGTRPFVTRRFDRATNLWPLALVSFGESWHNGHHSDPSCARHGLDRWQVDVSAGLIRLFERIGWVRDVRWSSPARVNARRQPQPG